MAMIPFQLWALSQRPFFSKKDAKTNNYAVDIVALALNQGGKIEKRWLDDVLFNSVSRIHENGVVELRYPNGLRSYSVAGKEPKTRFKQAGAIFPKRGWIKEEIGGTPIYHIQNDRFLDRMKVKIRKLMPLDYTMVYEIKGGDKLDQLDQYLLDLIIGGDPDDLETILKEYPHKVSMESPTGRTVYLKLDNPLSGFVTNLRIKGCMPKRGWFRRVNTHLTSDRIIKMVGDIPTIVKSINTMTPSGTMTYASAKNEFIAAQHFGGDEPLALGKYKLKFKGRSTGFIIFGMTGDDYRGLFGGRLNAWRNNNTNDVEFMGADGPAFFRKVGERLRDAHRMGLIHGAFHLGNIGYQSWGETKIPVFKDFEDSFRLEIGSDIYERVGWMFNDLAWPIQQWSRGFGKGLEIEGYPRQFLEGYFGGYVEKGVFYECLTREFATKMDAMDGGFVDIQEEFPNLYRALLIKEFTDSNIHDPMDVIDKNMNIIRWIQKSS